jgi:hypothetical protein
MTSKALFVGRFLAVFALLIVLGWISAAPSRYAAALQATASVVGPPLNGWYLEQRGRAGGPQELWFRRGTEEMRMQLGLEALALGMLPLLSLLGATPGLTLAGVAARAAIGVAALFFLDLLVLLLYPFLVGSPNAFTDIIGTFLGLLTFVGAPVILWFILTFRQLRSVWRLE